MTPVSREGHPGLQPDQAGDADGGTGGPAHPGVLNLSENEVRQITRFRRWEGLLCIGYNHVPIAFHATQKEYDAITTSPTDLRAKRRGRAG